MDIGLLLILLLVINRNKDKEIFGLKQIHDNTRVLNLPYTKEKIRIVKKIGPYFPEEFLPYLNNALVITEKFVQVYETLEFIQYTKGDYIKDSVPVENNKERLSYIINTIQREVSTEEVRNMGMAIEMILNIDKYKKMFTTLASVMANPEGLNNPSSILSIMEPFMDGKDEMEKKKLKDMANMFELMKTLDKPKKSKEEVDNDQEKKL